MSYIPNQYNIMTNVHELQTPNTGKYGTYYVSPDTRYHAVNVNYANINNIPTLNVMIILNVNKNDEKDNKIGDVYKKTIPVLELTVDRLFPDVIVSPTVRALDMRKVFDTQPFNIEITNNRLIGRWNYDFGNLGIYFTEIELDKLN